VAQADDWVLVGTIAGAFGVRGEMKVQLATDFPDRFKPNLTLYAGEDHRPVVVTSSRPIGDRVALTLADIKDRNAAQAMFSTPLYVRRGDVMPLPEGRFYHDEIIGLRVVTTSGDQIGTVVEILATGSNDVYVAREGDSEVLIPALKDIVKEIDLPAGKMVVEPIEGLL
jgi:16S rRNA processing protein RimM